MIQSCVWLHKIRIQIWELQFWATKSSQRGFEFYLRVKLRCIPSKPRPLPRTPIHVSMRKLSHTFHLHWSQSDRTLTLTLTLVLSKRSDTLTTMVRCRQTVVESTFFIFSKWNIRHPGLDAPQGATLWPRHP